MNHYEFNSYTAALNALCDEVKSAVQSAGKATVLVASYPRMVAFKEELAARGLGFGVKVETLNSWLTDLWELYGDGRTLVSSSDRNVMVRACIQERKAQNPQTAYAVSAGIVRLISDALRNAAPLVQQVPAHERAQFNAGEREVFALCDACCELFERYGLVELSWVCEKLMHMKVLADEQVLVFDAPTSIMQDKLIESARACAAFTVLAAHDASRLEKVEAAEAAEGEGGTSGTSGSSGTSDASDVCDEVLRANAELNALQTALFAKSEMPTVKAHGALRFLLPAGTYASDRLLYQEITALSNRANINSVAVACAQPYERFGRLAPVFAQAGFTVRLNCTVTFSKTAFGAAWLQLLQALDEDEAFDVAKCSDFALSAFSNMSMKNAYQFDAHMRQIRGMTRNDALENLQGNTNEAHRDFVAALTEGNFCVALELQRETLQCRYYNNGQDAFVGLQLEALNFALEMHQRAHCLHLSLTALIDLFQTALFFANVTYAAGEAHTPEENHPSITFMNQYTLAQSPACSFDVVALTDLTAESFPFQEKETALDVFLKKLGAYKSPQTITRLRKRFSFCIAAAAHYVLLERPLHDEKTDECRPSALYEEVLDCYRADPSNTADLDKVFALPKELMPYARTLGEEQVVANKLVNRGALAQSSTRELYKMGFPRLAAEDVAYLHAGKYSEESGVRPATLSASAIEQYLQCPYLWFTQRRIGMNELGNAFSPLEKGNFVHAVMKKFHDSLLQLGYRRVDEQNLAFAQSLFAELFDAQLESDRNSYRKGALVALNHLDEVELAQLRRQTLDFVEWESELFPSFSLSKNEYRFGIDEPVEYAGVYLTGSIDRIDIDANNRALIIDYKGSVGPEYAFFGSSRSGEFMLPKKVQALIYAQVARRQLGVEPVGALYVSYGEQKTAAGLYDAAALCEQEDTLYLDSEKSSTYSFIELLDQTEAAIAARLKQLQAGVIAPCPRDKDACTYCKLIGCTHTETEGGNEHE